MSDPDGRPEGRGTRGRVLPALLVGSIVVAAGAGVIVGRTFVSPEQQVARALPPEPSVLTAVVREDVLAARVVFRADVKDVRPVTVTTPTGLDTSLPVVTAVRVRRGHTVRSGQELLRVAERPVFVLVGRIPAFRDLTTGTCGVDVVQLQTGLRALGWSTGTDTAGCFGAGTGAAVRALYARAGVSPGSTMTGAPAPEDTDRGAGAEAAGRSGEGPAGSSAEAASGGGDVLVPRGEIVFVPHLPARVISLTARLGAVAPEKGLATIGSGDVVFTGDVDPVLAGQVKVGMTAVARSEVTTKTLRVKVTSVAAEESEPEESDGDAGWAGGRRVTLTANRTVPSSWVGQNVAVTVETASSDEKVLIVPVAAVSTDSSGRTYVTVLDAAGVQRDTVVELGLSAGGEQAVTAGSQLRAGDRVVIGQGPADTP